MGLCRRCYYKSNGEQKRRLAKLEAIGRTNGVWADWLSGLDLKNSVVSEKIKVFTIESDIRNRTKKHKKQDDLTKVI